MFLEHNGIKLEINKISIEEKSPNIWKFQNGLHKSMKKLQRFLIYFKLKENKTITYPDLWDAASTVL